MFFHLLWSRQRRLSTSWRYDVDVKNVVFLRLSQSADNWNKQTESWEWNFSFVAKLWRFDHMLFVVTSRCIRTDLGQLQHKTTFVRSHFATELIFTISPVVSQIFFRNGSTSSSFCFFASDDQTWDLGTWKFCSNAERRISPKSIIQIIFRTLILKITYIDNDKLSWNGSSLKRRASRSMIETRSTNRSEILGL